MLAWSAISRSSICRCIKVDGVKYWIREITVESFKAFQARSRIVDQGNVLPSVKIKHVS